MAKMVGLTQRSNPLSHRPVVPSYTDHDSFSQCEGSAHDPGARFCTYFSSKSWSAILWPPGRATDGRAALGWCMWVICSEGQTSRSAPPSTCAEETNAKNGAPGRRRSSARLCAHKVAAWIQRVEIQPTFEIWREGSRPPGECGAAPGVAGVATRDSGYSGSRLACCCERRCDARVRQQQRSCGGLSLALCQVQRSHATLQQRGWAWGRQEGGQLSRLCAPLTIFSFASGSTPGVARRRATIEVLPLAAAACRGVLPLSWRGGGEWGREAGEGT